ncbi:hypothetical protein MRX96_024951 [Rhipicephalus microplus]
MSFGVSHLLLKVKRKSDMASDQEVRGASVDRGQSAKRGRRKREAAMASVEGKVPTEGLEGAENMEEETHGPTQQVPV